MSLRITDDCINCGACDTACPTAAITEDTVREIRTISPELCTECVGFYDRSMCLVECPVECIEPLVGDEETEAELLQRAKALFPAHPFPHPPPSHFR